jgi:uncharacterized damage-inducible protein DinB
MFTSEEDLWKTKGKITNPAGTLALHLCGNLSNYIGKILGGFEYTRDRDAEFSTKGLQKSEVLEKIENTKQLVLSSLRKINITELNTTYPENVLGGEMTTGFFLLHLASHLSYHLGQVNYLRRAIEA